ncbi:MAG: hypothetical protein LJE91_10615 [Gammaproteobacteria bacterium]|jgi:hypothetical protein|nr:hypothetical protein [Gammaproteobacteria bacterium]
MSRTRTLGRLANAAILAAGIFAGTSGLAADFTIRYLDEPGKGFNDTTPILPVPGNPGNTLGQQRRNVMNHAVTVWGDVLASEVEIVVDASFSDTLECTSDMAVLGGATTSILLSNFYGAPEPDTWYPAALADALAGKDLCSEPGSRCAGEGDLVAVFNRKLDDDPECLNNARSWYYGLDHQPGSTGLDFLNVLLHEIAHGLGFQTFTNELTGGYFRNRPTVFDRYVRDLSNQQTWVQMTAEQRAISATNTGNVIWDGEAVAAAASNLIAGKAGGGVVLHTPDPPRPGSSLSHWDTELAPNALMEPRLSADLRSSTNLDLTPCVLKDLGWELAGGGSCAEDVPAYAEILVSSSALDLGRTVPGRATSFGVRVENPGKAPLQIGLRGESDGPDAPFSIASDTCSGLALAQGEGCVLEVLFAPTQTGTFDGKFVIPSNDPSNPALPITLTASADNGDTAAGSGEPTTGGTGNEVTNVPEESSDSVGGTGGGGALFALLPLLLPLGMRRGTRHREGVRGLRIG